MCSTRCCRSWKVNDELKQHFRPEFLNRIDDTIVFHQLSQEEILGIVDLMIGRIETQRGYDPVLGARPLRRTIQREIEDSLSERILFNELRPGQIVVVDCEGDPADIESPSGCPAPGRATHEIQL